MRSQVNDERDEIKGRPSAGPLFVVGPRLQAAPAPARLLFISTTRVEKFFRVPTR